jgi:glycosyltransferase involved in cell wall biosynthesis
MPVLERVLASLAAQSLASNRWELIVVDNGSEPAIALGSAAGLVDLRTVAEPIAGLTPARIRGIREARGEIVVFVDDDNLLDSDYLEQALRIAEEYPRIGAFGGRISPEFEAPEPTWLRPFRSHLALADFPQDEWSNVTGERAVLPCGAGLCMRLPLAKQWAERAAADPRRRSLGRTGSRTLSCEDTDMVLSCADAGWGMGRFTALHLTHVIPAARLEFAYQKRLAADIGYSYGRLLAIRGEASRGRKLIALAKTGLAFAGIKHRGKSRSLDVAFHHGVWKGLRSLA